MTVIHSLCCPVVSNLSREQNFSVNWKLLSELRVELNLNPIFCLHLNICVPHEINCVPLCPTWYKLLPSLINISNISLVKNLIKLTLSYHECEDKWRYYFLWTQFIYVCFLSCLPSKFLSLYLEPNFNSVFWQQWKSSQWISTSYSWYYLLLLSFIPVSFNFILENFNIQISFRWEMLFSIKIPKQQRKFGYTVRDFSYYLWTESTWRNS